MEWELTLPGIHRMKTICFSEKNSVSLLLHNWRVRLKESALPCWPPEQIVMVNRTEWWNSSSLGPKWGSATDQSRSIDFNSDLLSELFQYSELLRSWSNCQCKWFKCQENWQIGWMSSLIGRDRRGGGETEGDASSQHYLFCVVFCMMCLNEAQQEKLKLCGTNEKYLPRMEKLTGVCSLGGSRVILFLFPFCAGVFCWARPSEYTLVWQLDLPKWEPACVLVSMHLLNVEIIFSKSIKDLVKWWSHQQGACRALPCSVHALLEESFLSLFLSPVDSPDS